MCSFSPEKNPDPYVTTKNWNLHVLNPQNLSIKQKSLSQKSAFDFILRLHHTFRFPINDPST